MSGFGILLVHGYSGAPAQLEPLAGALEAAHGAEAVERLCLPGHGAQAAPEFDAEACLAAIAAAAAGFRARGRELVLVGHSTGATLALAAVARFGLEPRLLVLAAAPNRIDPGYPARWAAHGGDRAAPSLLSMARLVSLIRATGARPLPDCPVLIVQGDADRLVPAEAAEAWRARLVRPGRTVLVPGAGHQLFQGPGSAFALDLVTRAIADAVHVPGAEETAVLARLAAEEPAAARFLAASPASGRHLALCPSGAALAGAAPSLAEPVFANLEITTRCNLACAFCARSASTGPARDMSLATFRRVLDLLPHAYRVTLVGLGEPLLHPGLPAMVAEASRAGRRVALATNALLLTGELSRQLLDAGLDAIVFSLDAATPELAARVRSGTVLATALERIRAFCRLAPAAVSRAVFSAVSLDTAPHLEALVQEVATLGVDVLMLSDLNFPENLAHALWNHVDAPLRDSIRRAVRRAFSLGLPVLSVRGLEAFALPRHYHQHLLVPPASLYQRSARHSHCRSPWQTLPVAVDGSVSLCDCQSRERVGNLLEVPFAELWFGGPMAAHRGRMDSAQPPPACALCPRF